MVQIEIYGGAIIIFFSISWFVISFGLQISYLFCISTFWWKLSEMIWHWN